MYEFLFAGMLLTARKSVGRKENAKKKRELVKSLRSHSDPANSFPEDDIARRPE